MPHPRWLASLVAVALAVAAFGDSSAPRSALQDAEFHFLRLEYRDRPGIRRWRNRGWWSQDWPDAETHFNQGVRRLTLIDAGPGRHVSVLDDEVFDYPWIYVNHPGFWDLSDDETTRLREYLQRGGFLMADDFFGSRDWAVFQEALGRTFPDRPIVDMPEDDPLMHVLYDLDQRTQIPGFRHLRRGHNGGVRADIGGLQARWRGIYDDKGRLMVAIHFNQDVGDAWEHADWPEYPEPMTALAYRFGVNNVIYAMTH